MPMYTKYNTCLFSHKDPALRHMTIYEVFLVEPDYLLWCHETVQSNEFDQEVIDLLVGYKRAKEIRADWLSDEQKILRKEAFCKWQYLSGKTDAELKVWI
jgi:hypothetical protein